MKMSVFIKILGGSLAAFCFSSCVVRTERTTDLVPVPPRPDPYALPYPPKLRGTPPGKWREPGNEPSETSYNPYRKVTVPMKNEKKTISFSTIFHECCGSRNTAAQGYRAE